MINYSVSIINLIMEEKNDEGLLCTWSTNEYKQRRMEEDEAMGMALSDGFTDIRFIQPKEILYRVYSQVYRAL